MRGVFPPAVNRVLKMGLHGDGKVYKRCGHDCLPLPCPIEFQIFFQNHVSFGDTAGFLHITLHLEARMFASTVYPLRTQATASEPLTR